MIHLLISALMGVAVALMYMLSFAQLQKRASFDYTPAQSRIILNHIISATIRIVLIASFLSYLLLTNSFHLILVTVFFFMVTLLLLF